MKKIFMLVMCLLFCCSVCFANVGTKVSVIADVPQMLKNDQGLLDEVDVKVKKIFRSYKFEITPSIKDTLLCVHQYRQDNGLIMQNGGGAFLKTKDVQNIGNLLGSDYVFHIEVFPQGARGKVAVFSARVKYHLVCNLKVMNVRTGEFVIVKQFSEEGSTGTSFGGFKKHVAEFLPVCLENSKIDASNL